MTMIRYIAWSPERGWCGHRHTRLDLAEQCADDDGPDQRQAVAVDVSAAKRDQRELDRLWRGGPRRGRLYYEVALVEG
jgi:hypothetical protein